MVEGCTNPENVEGGDVGVPFLYGMGGLASAFVVVVDGAGARPLTMGQAAVLVARPANWASELGIAIPSAWRASCSKSANWLVDEAGSVFTRGFESSGDAILMRLVLAVVVVVPGSKVTGARRKPSQR